jgi:putative transposase
MGRITGEDRQALSEWHAELALYTQGELTAGAREHLRWLLERSLETEFTRQVGAERYVRGEGRCDWRNGYRKRDLVTELGLLRGLKVPRSRHGSYQPQVFARYARRQPGVDQVILEMFVAGVATRRVREILVALLGEGPSASTVSQIAKQLTERVREFHHRPLEDRWRFLVVDGVALAVKGAAGLRKRAVLVVYGMEGKGKRELLAFRLADTESEAEWTTLLQSLYQRGLEGKGLEVVVSDGAAGLKAALALVYPQAKHQRCWVHKLRNVSGKVRPADRQEVLAGARAIYLSSHRREAVQAFRSWKARWEGAYPKAVTCLQEDLEALLVCMDYPPALRLRIRTTNAIERCFREVRRRTRPMSAFTNDASCERIVYALIAHMNAQWSLHPRPHSTHKS